MVDVGLIRLERVSTVEHPQHHYADGIQTRNEQNRPAHNKRCSIGDAGGAWHHKNHAQQAQNKAYDLTAAIAHKDLVVPLHFAKDIVIEERNQSAQQRKRDARTCHYALPGKLHAEEEQGHHTQT